MACILPVAYMRNIPRGTKFLHELSPNFSHPVEPQMPFGNGRKKGAIMSLSKFDINSRDKSIQTSMLDTNSDKLFLCIDSYNTYRWTSFFWRRRFLRFWI